MYDPDAADPDIDALADANAGAQTMFLVCQIGTVRPPHVTPDRGVVVAGNAQPLDSHEGFIPIEGDLVHLRSEIRNLFPESPPAPTTESSPTQDEKGPRGRKGIERSSPPRGRRGL